MVTMGYNMTMNRLTSRVLGAFVKVKSYDQYSTAYQCANNISTCSNAQGSHTQYYCDTSGCEHSELSSVETRHDSITVDIKPDDCEDDITDDSDYCHKTESVQRNSPLEKIKCANNYLKELSHNDRSKLINEKLIDGEMKDQRGVTVELMVHPGYPSEADDLGCGTGADDFACSPARKHELDVLTCKSMLEWYKEQDISLVSQVC